MNWTRLATVSPPCRWAMSIPSITRGTSGNPNTVHNPLFKVSGVPQGTTVIRFQLKDLDVPGYNHGGGYVTIAKDGTVPAKSFKYKSPCPPSGKHTYEWTATAMTRKNGKALAKAAARASYP